MSDASAFGASVRERLAHWRAQFGRLSARERTLVVLGAGFVLAALVYGLIYAPIQRDLARLRQSVPVERARLAVMRAQAEDIARYRAAAPVERTPAGDWRSALERSASAHGLSGQIARIAPDGANATQVTLESAAFLSVIAWLAELNREYGLSVQNAELEAKATPGQVSGRVSLRGPAQP